MSSSLLQHPTLLKADHSGSYVALNPRFRDQDNKSLRTLHAALANGHATIVTVGTSESEGQNATTLANRWVELLRDILGAYYNPVGVRSGGGYYPFFYAGPNVEPLSPFTLGVGSGIKTHFGLGQRSWQIASANVAITGTLVCSSFDLFYVTSAASGSFTVTIDGTLVATIDASPALSDGNKWNSGALGLGPHTIVVTPTSATSVTVNGVRTYQNNENTGIHVLDGGQSGSKTNDWLTLNSFWQANIAAVAPDAVILETGTNDWGGNVDVNSFATQLTSLIALIRSVAPNASIILPVMFERQAAGATQTWLQFVNAIYTVAVADGNCFVVDMYQRFQPGNQSSANAPWSLIDSDLVHMTDKGQKFWVDALADAIMPHARNAAPAYPKTLQVPVWATPAAQTNWSAVAQNNLYFNATTVLSTGVQNALIAFDVLLAAGTYSLDLLHRQSTNRGIYTVTVDGTTVGTVDGYAASAVSTASRLTGIAVTGTGPHRVQLQMLTKNGSSSSYFGDISGLSLTRTA